MKSTRQRTDIDDGLWMVADVYGSGSPVVLLHGIPGSPTVWGGVVELLASEHTVVVPHLIGFGDSARTDRIEHLWADRQAEALLALLRELELPPPLLVAHDFGGPVAAHLLARAPACACGLVVAATNAFGDTPVPFPLSGIFLPVVGRLWERMLFSAPSLRMMVKLGTGTKGPALDVSGYVTDPAQARAVAVIFGSALRELNARYRPITDQFRQVRLPVRLLWGDSDAFFEVEVAERTAALFGRGSLRILKGAGHFLPEERPEAFVEEIAALERELADADGRPPHDAGRAAGHRTSVEG